MLMSTTLAHYTCADENICSYHKLPFFWTTNKSEQQKELRRQVSEEQHFDNFLDKTNQELRFETCNRNIQDY